MTRAEQEVGPSGPELGSKDISRDTPISIETERMTSLYLHPTFISQRLIRAI